MKYNAAILAIYAATLLAVAGIIQLVQAVT